MMTVSASSEDDQYQQLLANVRNRFAGAVASKPALFTTATPGLFDVFLGAMPEERRQHYTCNACRRFVDRFGGLVTIGADGATSPVMWDADAAPPFFRAAVRAVARVVIRAKVDGVFLSEEKSWGLPQNKSEKAPFLWKHMAVTPDPGLVFRKTVLLNADQKAAERREEHGMLNRGLAEFPIETVRQAHTLLTTGQLYRSEKCIGVAKWLLDLHEAIDANKGRRDNLTWRAAATAPTGFCHVRSGMIGTLMEDIAAGLPFADIKAKFDAKMNPLQYQRPQAPPTAGNIAQAEKVMASLGAAGSLARRFAKIEEVDALWRPAPPKPDTEATSGLFAHLAPKGKAAATQITAPPVTMTWEKFARTVLPDAESIEFYAAARPASYFAFVTAANPEAPPILQWDREEKRNPMSVYVYHNGSMPASWNLSANTWHNVTAITLRPHAWYGAAPLAHQGDTVFFLLSGARDVNYQRSGCFFPETLRSEFHGIRATLEAYANNATIAGKDEATACGIGLSRAGSGTWDHLFRVTAKGATVTYRLDRWD